MKQQIALIGGGNMGRAIAGGLLAGDFKATQLEIVEPDETRAAELRSTLKVNCVARIENLTNVADVLILAVKPQIMRQIVQQLAGVFDQQNLPLIVSIAAGITSEQISRWFGGHEPRIVRVMPNTPALVGAGAAGLFATENVSEDERQTATQILESVGLALWVETENELDAVTALSGSGPAYFFLILEALETAGSELGLTATMARELAIQTCYGSALLARQSGVDPAELRRQVTSPGGTTERALATLIEHQLPDSFRAALKAAHQRAIELSQESDS